MDREGRPRSDIPRVHPARACTGERTKGNAIALESPLGVTFSEIDIRDTETLMLTEMGHPFARRREGVTDVTVENVRPACAGLSFRLDNQRGGIVSAPATSRLALAAHLRRRRPDVAHYNVKRRAAQDPDSAPDQVGESPPASRRRGQRRAAVGARNRDHSELVPSARTRDPEAARRRWDRMSAGLLAVPGRGWGLPPVERGRSGVARLSDAERGDCRAGFPRQANAYSLADIRRWLKVFVQRFYSFSQFKRYGVPNAEVSAGGAVDRARLARAVGHAARIGSTRSSARLPGAPEGSAIVRSPVKSRGQHVTGARRAPP